MSGDGVRFGPLTQTVHLCVDMQQMFAKNTEWHTPWLERVLPCCVRLCEHAPEHTVFTRFIPARAPGQAEGTWARYYARWPQFTTDEMDPGLIDIVPELSRFAPPADVFDKRRYSPWAEGDLHQKLRQRAVTTIIISGAETDVCVLAAVLGAIDHGYRSVIAADAVCSSDDHTHDALMKLYMRRFSQQIEIATTAEILEHWRI